jgi:hypothetical protein
VDVFGPGQVAVAEPVDRLFHRVEGLARAGQDAELHQLVNRVGQGGGLGLNLVRVVPDDQRAHRHPVLRQRPGLVHAQDGGRPQRLDRRHAAGEDPVFRDAPGAEREEDREHNRILLR